MHIHAFIRRIVCDIRHDSRTINGLAVLALIPATPAPVLPLLRFHMGSAAQLDDVNQREAQEHGHYHEYHRHPRQVNMQGAYRCLLPPRSHSDCCSQCQQGHKPELCVEHIEMQPASRFNHLIRNVAANGGEKCAKAAAYLVRREPPAIVPGVGYPCGEQKQHQRHYHKGGMCLPDDEVLKHLLLPPILYMNTGCPFINMACLSGSRGSRYRKYKYTYFDVNGIMRWMRYGVGMLVLLIGLGSVSPVVSAHPPSDMALAYDSDVEVLNITISHAVSNVDSHYIDALEISKNDVAYTTKAYSTQPSSSTFTYSISVQAVEGDILAVTASCNQYGSLKKSLTLNGETTETNGAPGFSLLLLCAAAAIALLLCTTKK